MTRLGPLLSPILVGRDDLLDQAERRVADAARGRGQFLLLAGEAGIGKSRLMAAIERKAIAAGFRASAGLVAPQDRDVPGASLLDLARTMTRMRGFADLGQQLLELADETFEASAPRRRTLVLRAVDLIVAAADRPLMLSFDDLQWADDLSLEIITELARATRERPLLLVGAYRTDELVPASILRPWRARLLSQRMAEEARLAPLTHEQTALMTTVILGTGLPAPRAVVEAVYERTDGVPLHIEELLGALDDAQRTDSRAVREAAVPETLGDAVLQRIGRLSPEAQRVARSGAVIGRCFVPDVLAGIMDDPVESLREPLRELIEHDVLDRPGPRGLYDFRHQLLRDTLYRTLSEAELRRLHARAAEFGMELEGQSEVHASLHYERAGMRIQAFRSALAGARAAAKVIAHQEAFDLYRRAIDNLPPDLAPSEALGIYREAVVEAGAREQMDAWRRWALAGRELGQVVGDRARAAAFLVDLLAIERRNAGSLTRRLEMADAALAELDPLPLADDVRRIRGELLLARTIIADEAGDLRLARESLDAARVEAAALDDGDLLLTLDSLDGQVATSEGRIAQGIAAMGTSAEVARDRALDETSITNYSRGAIAAIGVLDYRHAAAWIREGIAYADSIEQSYCSHILQAVGGLVAWGDGRWDDAVGEAAQALMANGSFRGAAMARWPLAYVALGRGDLAEARRQLASAHEFADAYGAPDFRLAAAWGTIEVALLSGEAGAAVDASEAAIELAERTGERGQFAPIALSGTRARLAAGRPADAARWVERCDAFLHPVGWLAFPVIDHARGLVALSDGSVGIARSSFERAISGWEAKGRIWEGLWARLDLAGSLGRSRRIVEATTLIADVREAALRLGSRPLVDRAGVLARQTRGRVAEDEPWHPLTARELEVARLIAAGSTNAEIAAELRIAPRTAGAHVEQILAKLGASRRAEIATWVSTVPSAAASVGVASR
jgi:DNA-binding CsgD family transcriptional regulator/tetratricopeptide (TPR) repeat protein